MKVELREIYNHNLNNNYEVSTRFFVLTKNGREVEVKNLANAFFPASDADFQKQLVRGYSGHRNEVSYEAEKDFLLGNKINLMEKGQSYVGRFFDLMDVYYWEDESVYPDLGNTFTAEIAPQALRVLIEPWKYGIDRRSARRGS